MAEKVLDLAFAALADATRRGVIRLLRQEPHRAGDLATELDVSAPALSRHLRILRECKLVERLGDETDGRVTTYRLRRETFAELRIWLDDIESMWEQQLTAFATHVQRTRGKK